MSEPDQLLMELLDDPSFVRWINGKANHKEVLEWEQWEKRSQLHTDLKRKAELLYSMPLERSDAFDIEEQLAGLHHKIDTSEKEKIFTPPSQIRRRPVGYYGAVAAVVGLLITIVGVLSVYNFHEEGEQSTSQPLFTTIEVGYGERGSLKISDGSSIQLNSNSSLYYSPEQFNSSMVEVWLKGEAYFSITRNPGNRERTFVVHTPDGEVRVLGTRFNVNTRSQRTGVVLEEGSIEVVLTDSLQPASEPRLLHPGEKALLAAGESEIRVQKVDTLLYTAWLDGKLVFDETPLTDIIQNIEQTYGVSIEVEEMGLLDEKMTGTLRNPDVETLLKGLAEVFDLEIQQKTEDTYSVSEQ